MSFIHKDFLLESDEAKELYHNHPEKLPIIDYHCHLSPREIAEDKRFRSITEVWLGGDHYKWRVMRANGVDEKYITGDASDWEKFEKWAMTMPYTLRNPLYHWTHLELQSAFGIDKVLSPATVREIYDRCNELLPVSTRLAISVAPYRWPASSTHLNRKMLSPRPSCIISTRPTTPGWLLWPPTSRTASSPARFRWAPPGGSTTSFTVWRHR